MNNGIWEIGSARLCLPCQTDMKADYVIRCDGHPQKTVCERCGRETMTMAYRYTMNKAGLTKVGRLEG